MSQGNGHAAGNGTVDLAQPLKAPEWNDEEQLIGSVLFNHLKERPYEECKYRDDPDVNEAMATLKPQDFKVEVNAVVWREMQKLSRRFEWIDPAILQLNLKDAGDIAKDEVSRLLLNYYKVQTAANTKVYFEKILRRNLETATRLAITDAHCDLLEGAKSTNEVCVDLQCAIEDIRGASSFGAKFIKPKTVTEILSTEDEEDVDWLWSGFLARGLLTTLIGYPKAGKSTLLGHMLKSSTDGGECITTVKDFRVLIISEEPQRMLRKRYADLGLKDNVHTVPKLPNSKLTFEEWQQMIDEIVSIASDYDAVIFDSFSYISPIEDENSASEVGKAIAELSKLTSLDLAVLLVHHSKKDGGDEGKAARGSGHFMAAVDVQMELRRFDTTSTDDKRRRIVSYSRDEATPPDVVIEIREQEGYVNLGSKAEYDEVLKEQIEEAGDDRLIATKVQVAVEVMSKESGGFAKSKIRKLAHIHPRNIDEVIGSLLGQELIEILGNPEAARPKYILTPKGRDRAF